MLASIGAGVGGASVRALEIDGPDGMVAWVSTTDRSGLPRDERLVSVLIQEHERIVSAAALGGVTVVPAKVGRPYADDAACVADVRGRETEILVGAIRVAGSLEMSVIVSVRPNVASPARSDGKASPENGRAYLAAVRERINAAEHSSVLETAVERLHDAVAGHTSGEARRDGALHSMAVSHLVLREAVDLYRSAVESAELPEGVRVNVDGPRAAYSFAAFIPVGTILAN